VELDSSNSQQEIKIDFIIKKFLSHNKNKKRQIHPFTTTATDTDLVKNIFKTVNRIIFEKIMQNIMLD